MTIRALDFLLSGGLLTFLPLQAQSGDGVWRSRGCGDVYEIQGPTVRTYQVTSTTCFPGFTAQRDPATVAGRGATLTHGGGEIFFIRAGGRRDHKLLHNEGSDPTSGWIGCRGCQQCATTPRRTLPPATSRCLPAPGQRITSCSIRRKSMSVNAKTTGQCF